MGLKIGGEKMAKQTQQVTPASDNELVKLLIIARTETITPAANAILSIASKYGIKGLECLALLDGVHTIPSADFVVIFLKDNARIDPLTIPVVQS